MSQLDKILDGLIRRTEGGKLKWRRSLKLNTYVASIDAISVVVRELRDSRHGVSNYHIEILDAQGALAEALDTNVDNVDNASARLPTREQARQLERLYELARRSAVNPTATLEQLVKALES